jgi:PAP2 superfamily
MKQRQKKWNEAVVIIIASTIAALVLLVVAGVARGAADSSGGGLLPWLSYYGHTLSGSLADLLYGSILFFCLVIILLVIWSLGKSFLLLIFPKLRGKLGVAAAGDKSDDPRRVFLAAAKRSREMLLIIPAMLYITLLALVMGEANEFSRARLQDLRVIGAEHWLFGNYIFAALGSIHYPHFLIVFIIWSFGSMSVVLIGAGMVIAYLSPQRFRELLVAFCLGLLIMIPMWIALPVLSPQDRFIDNVYNLPMPPSIDVAVKNYHPQGEIADFLANVRKGKANLPALPTSTIPSAHIFWASIVGYYLFRTKKWLGWITLPVLLASSFGTILLAQHYFLDIPAGVAIAAIAIWLAEGIGGSEKKSS